MIKKYFLTALCLLAFLINANCQTEKFTSRLYFPGAIGINIPSGDQQTSIRSGFTLNTAMEYRPQYTNAIFFRFNYDALTNHYKSILSQLPTNVTSGKLSAAFFMVGAGYRRKLNGISVYGLIQPGYNSSGYDAVTNNSSGVAVNSISRNYPALKISAGIEYYLAPHFALVMETGYYHLFEHSRTYILNPDYVSYSIGFTTTLF
ncbi:outer membrane beta-barrel protein [Mucilaginibacter xinganensis]|uniref:Outer membrane protein beta-barrel domain-containing protein n=1 Tax=Mucilaginibacter xinganensis TaxID=1234841 RepID=A0A223P481_9SPHI|nr:outer membrane beta-barrel protein [Mucilaginibacter xinganensis]ASU36611.1 Outer membrane protein beta-barrel domain-containing protein [Mucilaginibacter xinganensis]